MNEIIKKNGVAYGVGLGVFSVLVTALMYGIDLSLFGSWWIGILLIAVSLVVYCLVIYNTKKQLNGQITFKEAFTVFFISAAISLAISTAFMILLFGFVDPQASDAIKDIQIENTVAFMEKMNAPAAEIDKATDRIMEQDTYGLGTQITGYFMSLAFMSVLGLILALIFKSRPAYKE